MKQKLVLCAVLLLAFADIVAARNSTVDGALSAGSSAAEKQLTRISLERLPYKNLRESSKWSKLIHGRALTATLRKKNAHSLQDVCIDCDSLFPGEGDEMIGPLYDLNAGAKGCGWSCCFKQCMGSAMGPASSLCLSSCTACGTVGGAFACAVCGSCGAVGFAAIEFCGLHCCVNPGC